MNTTASILSFAQGGFIVLVILFIVGMLIFGALWAAKRRKELTAWATQHGMSFNAAKKKNFGGNFPSVKWLNTGRSRYAKNFIEGSWKGRGFLGFDYHYTTGSGKNSQHHSLSGVIITSPILLQPLFIRPEGFFDKMTEFFGYDDIDFESAEFSKKFYVKAENKRWAYDVIHTRVMEFLLKNPRMTIQFDMHHVIGFKKQRLFKPYEFGETADVLTGILDLLPDYVIQQQKGNM